MLSFIFYLCIQSQRKMLREYTHTPCRTFKNTYTPTHTNVGKYKKTPITVRGKSRIPPFPKKNTSIPHREQYYICNTKGKPRIHRYDKEKTTRNHPDPYWKTPNISRGGGAQHDLAHIEMPI